MRTPNNLILVTGCPRSGTTWVGSTLAKSRKVIYAYEPFNTDVSLRFSVEERFPTLTDDTAGPLKSEIDAMVSLSRLGPRATSAVYGLVERYTGRKKIAPRLAARHAFKSGYSFFKPDHVLIKDPLAFFSAEWLSQTYGAQVVIMARHPAAFVSSYLKLGWRNESADLMDRQHPTRHEDLSEDIEQYRSNTGDEIAGLILQWKIFAVHTLSLIETHKKWCFALHEDFCLDPERSFAALFDALGLEFTESIKDQIQNETSADNNTDLATHEQHQLLRNSSALKDAWKTRVDDEIASRVIEEAGPLFEVLKDAIRRASPHLCASRLELAG